MAVRTLFQPLKQHQASRVVLSMAEAIEIAMPALSSTMTEGKIVEWTAKVGDKIKAGQTIMVVESDKADMDVEAFEEGFLAKIVFGDGASAPVGATVALLAKSKEEIPAVQAMTPGASPATAPAAAPAPESSAPAGGGASLGVPTNEIAMPALSSTMTEGKIVEWTAKVGDKIKAGQTIMVVESDKADMDVEAFESGYVAAILAKAGEATPVGAPCALLVDNEADVEKVKAALASGASVGGGASAAPASPPPEAAAPPAAANAPSKPTFDFAEVAMPALSSTMTSGKIVAWTAKVGDSVKAGQTVMVVESDKADMDVEAFEGGVLASILTGEGDSAKVGDPVALLAAKKEDVPALQAYGQALKASLSGAPAPAPADSAAAAPAPAASTPVAATAASPPGERVVASGYAKKLASEAGVDLRSVPGTGLGGRVVGANVIAAAAGKPMAKPLGYRSPPGSATPLAKRLAAEAGLDLKSLKGTGEFGRVTADDVLIATGKKSPVKKQAAGGRTGPVKAPKPAPGPMPTGTKPMDGMMKAVAKNMEKTLDVPIFRVSRLITTDKFDKMYAEVKGQGVSVSALLAKAVAKTLERHPILNAAYDPAGAIKYNPDINIAMAVALDGGLITPTLRNANAMDLVSLGGKWRELVKKAQEKRLAPDEYTTGTFTISNLGMYGVSAFDAILPPGQGSILAIGGSIPTVVVRKDGSFAVQKQMTVTITCDHRHIYGADAAEFLRDLAELMEEDVESLLD
jgi:pyruvate dehydrogenase E2 component (dihydrolipoamide acetyltransferase)